MKTEAGRVVSEGTLRWEDLVPKFLSELERYSLGRFGEFIREIQAGEWKDQEVELVEALGEAINDEGGTALIQFGAHEGDGACFGWWTTEEV